MHAFSTDLRERIVAAYDQGGSTQPQVAARFGVSLGLVKKLLSQRRRVGHVTPLGHRGGHPPKIRKTHLRRLRALVRKQPDLTLEQLRAASGLPCSLVAIHRALVKAGLTYKKRRSGPVSRTAPT